MDSGKQEQQEQLEKVGNKLSFLDEQEAQQKVEPTPHKAGGQGLELKEQDFPELKAELEGELVKQAHPKHRLETIYRNHICPGTNLERICPFRSSTM